MRGLFTVVTEYGQRLSRETGSESGTMYEIILRFSTIAQSIYCVVYISTFIFETFVGHIRISVIFIYFCRDGNLGGFQYPFIVRHINVGP